MANVESTFYPQDRYARSRKILAAYVAELERIANVFTKLPQDTLSVCRKLSVQEDLCENELLLTEVACLKLINVTQEFAKTLNTEMEKFRNKLAEEVKSTLCEIDLVPELQISQVLEELDIWLAKKYQNRQTSSEWKKQAKHNWDDQIKREVAFDLDTTAEMSTCSREQSDDGGIEIVQALSGKPSAPEPKAATRPVTIFESREQSLSASDFKSELTFDDWSVSLLREHANVPSSEGLNKGIVLIRNLHPQVSDVQIQKIVSQLISDEFIAKKDGDTAFRLLFKQNLSIKLSELLEILSRNESLLSLVKSSEEESPEDTKSKQHVVVGLEFSSPGNSVQSANKLNIHEREAREKPHEDIDGTKLAEIVPGLKVVQMDKQAFLPKVPEYPVSQVMPASSVLVETKLQIATNKDLSEVDLQDGSMITYHEEIPPGETAPSRSIRAIENFGHKLKVLGRVDLPIAIYEVVEPQPGSVRSGSTEGYPRLKRRARSTYLFMARAFKNSWNRTSSGLVVKDEVIYFLGYNPATDYPVLKDRKLPIISSSLVELRCNNLKSNDFKESYLYHGVESFVVEDKDEPPQHPQHLQHPQPPQHPQPTQPPQHPQLSDSTRLPELSEPKIQQKTETGHKITLLTNNGEVVRVEKGGQEKKYSLKNIDGLNLWSCIARCGTRYVVSGWIQTQNFNCFYLLDQNLGYKNSLKVLAADRAENMPVGQMLARTVSTRDGTSLKVPILIAGLTSGHILVLALGADCLQFVLKVPNTSQSKENSAISLCGMGGYIYAGGNAYVERFLLRF